MTVLKRNREADRGAKLFAVLVIFATVAWGYAYALRAHAVVRPIPFEGRIVNIEYNCLCSGSIMLTVEPKLESSVARQGPQTTIMYYWAADALSRILGEIIDFPFPGPRIYMFYQIFYTGNQTLLGLYYPQPVPCIAYVGTACSETGEAQGVLIGVGTSLY